MSAALSLYSLGSGIGASTRGNRARPRPVWNDLQATVTNGDVELLISGTPPGEQVRIAKEFSSIRAVDAVYCEQDRDGVLMVFIVVAQHTDDTYKEVVETEARLLAGSASRFEARVRAHQGREPREAVPVGAAPLFLR